jgi:uncharacterized protein (TIGR02001 family)
MRGSVARLGIAAWACVAATARAADGLHGSAAVTSDYVHRGISQSDGAAALQGSLTWYHPTGVYVGGWASSVETVNTYVYPRAAGSTGAPLELDLFAGIGKPVGTDWTLDLKTLVYLYPHDPAPVSYDYVELSAGAAWRERWFMSVSVAPRTRWTARTERREVSTAVNAEIALQQRLGPWLTAIAGGGYSELLTAGRSGYAYGSLSLALQLHHASLELGWFTTDTAARALFGDRITGSRAAITATVTF